MRSRFFSLVFAASIWLSPFATQAQEVVHTIDRLVAHTSTVPAIAGQPIDLFVREKIPASIFNAPDGRAPQGKVVLFVHGGYSPSTLAFDLAYRDYSWMDYLARAGYDTFAMDMTGYGRSGHPMMDDPCNLIASQRSLMTKKQAAACTDTYPFDLVNSDSETADIDRVVDFIRKLRGVDKVTLIGWSGGGVRTGTYLARYPEKVEKYVILASSNYSRKNPSDKPAVLPKPGAPVSMQTRAAGIDQRWLGTSKCADTIEPGVPEMIWKLNLDNDPVGATWGTGGLRAPTRTYWGWNAAAAAKIKVPTLIMSGEQDALTNANLELFDDLGASQKVFLGIACATHFVVWEKQARVLHKASLEWLQKTSLQGATQGSFRADEKGVIKPR